MEQGETRLIKCVGVVGLGLMGSGIAQLCVQSGYHVLLYDVNEKHLEKAYRTICERIEKWCKKNGESSAKDDIISRLSKGKGLDEFGCSDLIIEAITERLEPKQELFATLEKIVSPQTILASNTSGISITKIASRCKGRDRVIGTHFFNPAPKMQLVEVIRGEETSSHTVKLTLSFVKSLNKIPVQAKDVPGFVVNRIITPMLNEAMRSLEAGISTKEDIDQAIKLAMGHPMGPLELSDFIGLDTILSFMEMAYEETGNAAFKPCGLLKELVQNGNLGVKTGKGFYEYTV